MIAPTPTRIPETQNLNQLDWQNYSNITLGIGLSYPSTWSINLLNNQISLSNSTSTITISKSSQIPTNFKSNFSLSLGVPAQFETNLITSIMGKNTYSIVLTNPTQNQLDNLVFGKLIQTIDLTINPLTFSCLTKNSASTQPTADYFIWEKIHCQP